MTLVLPSQNSMYMTMLHLWHVLMRCTLQAGSVIARVAVKDCLMIMLGPLRAGVQCALC